MKLGETGDWWAEISGGMFPILSQRRNKPTEPCAMCADNSRPWLYRLSHSLAMEGTPEIDFSLATLISFGTPSLGRAALSHSC